MIVKPKKSLGQHFLRDENIARKIAASLSGWGNYKNILEVGPGMGILSKYLIEDDRFKWYGIEYDKESVDYFNENFPKYSSNLIHGDVLKYNINALFDDQKLGLIGNFPYNISSQIIFKALEHRDQIPEIVGMFQKEVALRLASKHGNKTYGILSVLCQAFYNVEILFQVGGKVFFPPPKVTSAVIRMTSKEEALNIKNEKLFFEIVKKAFNQRRKTLRNALKQNLSKEAMTSDIFDKRAEQLSVEDFVSLVDFVDEKINE